MKKILIAFSVVSLSLANAHAQGCSDAGFCSTGILQTGARNADTMRGSAAISVAGGLGEKDALIVSPQLEIRIPLKKEMLEFRLPYQVVSGNLGKNIGIGDLMITLNSPSKPLFKSKSVSISSIFGFRVGLGDASDDYLARPLPMAYQTSLGTTDIMAGFAFKIKKFLNVGLGIQAPLIHYNKNGYDKMGYRNNDTSFFASRKLERNGDVFLRLDGQYSWKRFGISGGPLAIYHVANDKMTMANGTETTITGSAGLTVNINFGVYYATENWKFDIAAGAPVLQRDSRPDGLTRSFVVAPRITFMF